MSATPTVPAQATIASGGTAQALYSASVSRRGFAVQNESSGDLKVAWGVDPSTTVGVRIAAGALYETPENACPTDAVKIWGATTAQAFQHWEW